jgi:TolB protein
MIAVLAARYATARPRVDAPQAKAPIRLALPEFRPATPHEADRARQITQVVTANLRMSGLFELVDTTGVVTGDERFLSAPRFPVWRGAGAQALVEGRVVPVAGQISVSFRLWDVAAGQMLQGSQYQAPPGDWRKIANAVSEMICERLTGEKRRFQ